jgi:hypothetical protein
MAKLFYACSALSLTVAILAATNSVIGIGGPPLSGLRAFVNAGVFGATALATLFFGYVCESLDAIAGRLSRPERLAAADRPNNPDASAAIND